MYSMHFPFYTSFLHSRPEILDSNTKFLRSQRTQNESLPNSYEFSGAQKGEQHFVTS